MLFKLCHALVSSLVNKYCDVTTVWAKRDCWTMNSEANFTTPRHKDFKVKSHYSAKASIRNDSIITRPALQSFEGKMAENLTTIKKKCLNFQAMLDRRTKATITFWFIFIVKVFMPSSASLLSIFFFSLTAVFLASSNDVESQTFCQIKYTC